MKTNIFLFSVAMIVLLFSCAKDDSNYTYSDGEYINIEGIQNTYTLISQKDRLQLSPVVSSNKDGDFEYRWGIYETNVQGRVEPLDTIARTKDLDYFITEDAKAWVLVFMVKNKKTGFTQYKNTTLNVNTEFTRGWYVLKDDGNMSDLDLFLIPTSPKSQERIDNIYSTVNGHKIEGKGTFLSFFTAYKSTITGALGNTRALMVSTEKDIQSISINSLKTIRDKNDIFLGGPKDVGSPSFVFIGSSANYVMNKGQLHHIYAMSANNGQFGDRLRIDAKDSPYQLAPSFCVSTYADPIMFDNTSSSFVTLANGSGSMLVNFAEDAPTSPLTNTDKKALFIGFKEAVYLPAPIYAYQINGYGIFQGKTDPSLKTIVYLQQNKQKMKASEQVIESSKKLYNATQYALLNGDENMLFFVNNNQVWNYNLSNAFEQLQFTPPAGEEITFIRHLKYTTAADTGYPFNLFVVGVKSGAGYKVYMFTKSSGNLDTTPYQVLEGNGAARAIFYISPNVSEGTFPNN